MIVQIFSKLLLNLQIYADSINDCLIKSPESHKRFYFKRLSFQINCFLKSDFWTLSELAKLKEQGKFKELGLSNYSSWLTCEVVNIAKQNGFPVPTVYQGMYSGKVIMILLDFSRNTRPRLFGKLFVNVILIYIFINKISRINNQNKL